MAHNNCWHRSRKLIASNLALKSWSQVWVNLIFVSLSEQHTWFIWRLAERHFSWLSVTWCIAVIFTQIESRSVVPILRGPKYFIGPRSTHSFIKMASGTVDREMEQFILAEKEKVRFQSLVRSLTDECWEKCVEKVGSKLDSKTETCLVNCVERFLDTSNFVANRLSQMGES